MNGQVAKTLWGIFLATFFVYLAVLFVKFGVGPDPNAQTYVTATQDERLRAMQMQLVLTVVGLLLVVVSMLIPKKMIGDAKFAGLFIFRLILLEAGVLCGGVMVAFLSQDTKKYLFALVLAVLAMVLSFPKAGAAAVKKV